MINALNEKVVVLTPPGAIVDNAAVTTASLDCLGVGWVTIEVYLGPTDIAVAALKLRESNDDGSSDAYADVPAADFSVSPATLPSATDDNHVFAIQVNMLGRKRYLDLTLTGGDGTAGAYFMVVARLSRMQTTPSTASDRGYTQELFAG
jgi:hypothetical protein